MLGYGVGLLYPADSMADRFLATHKDQLKEVRAARGVTSHDHRLESKLQEELVAHNWTIVEP
jgi:hypothetical protein